jgi:hypothetical protein
MINPWLLDRAEIARRLQERQRLQALGASITPMTRVAEKAGVSRPTLYAAARGARVCLDTQRRLSYALRELNDEPQGPNRIAHVAFGPNGPQLRFGLGPVKVQGG